MIVGAWWWACGGPPPAEEQATSSVIATADDALWIDGRPSALVEVECAGGEATPSVDAVGSLGEVHLVRSPGADTVTASLGAGLGGTTAPVEGGSVAWRRTPDGRTRAVLEGARATAWGRTVRLDLAATCPGAAASEIESGSLRVSAEASRCLPSRDGRVLLAVRDEHGDVSVTTGVDDEGPLELVDHEPVGRQAQVHVRGRDGSRRPATGGTATLTRGGGRVVTVSLDGVLEGGDPVRGTASCLAPPETAWQGPVTPIPPELVPPGDGAGVVRVDGRARATAALCRGTAAHLRDGDLTVSVLLSRPPVPGEVHLLGRGAAVSLQRGASAASLVVGALDVTPSGRGGVRLAAVDARTRDGEPVDLVIDCPPPRTASFLRPDGTRCASEELPAPCLAGRTGRAVLTLEPSTCGVDMVAITLPSIPDDRAEWPADQVELLLSTLEGPDRRVRHWRPTGGTVAAARDEHGLLVVTAEGQLAPEGGGASVPFSATGACIPPLVAGP